MNNILFVLSDFFMKPDLELTKLENEKELLGELCINRIAGIAYLNLKKLINVRIIKEFENTLAAVFNENVNRTRDYKRNVEMIARMLEGTNFPYALLKGAYLTTKIYEEGCRTSNDLDILVEERNVAELQDILKENGFIQGYYSKSKDTIVPADRREIIFSKMNYGETVPFAKFIDGRLFYVDINFSVDFKPEQEKAVVNKLLSNIEKVDYRDTYYYTLDRSSFMIHLCCHLYKEATTMEWVKEGRDLQLYKFSDINICLHDYTFELYNKLYEQIKYMEVEKECYYTLFNASKIYPELGNNPDFSEFIEKIKPSNLAFMKQIVDPRTNKIYQYEMSFEEWFFVEDKVKHLYVINE